MMRRSASQTASQSAAAEHVALGLVAGELLHEICNAFTIVKREADEALTESGVSPAASRALRSASEAADRIVLIADSLLDTTRATSGGLVCNVGDVVGHVLRHVRCGGKIEIASTEAVSAAIPAVVLEHVVLNVLANAVAAVPGDAGVITVEWSNCSTWNNFELTVTDNGHGLQGSPRQGRRYGLSVCQRLLKRYGGHIAMAPNPSRGTTVKITLPVSDTKKKAA